MSKIPECDRCQYFVNSPYLVCGVNPYGPADDTCEDFSATDQVAIAEIRQPLGGGYYTGDWIPQPFPVLSVDEQLALLDWHPQFTNCYPNCETPIAEAVDSQWACGHCQWTTEERD